MMNGDVLQKIFDIILPALPREWRKMMLYVAYTGGSYTMKYYTADSQGVYTDCFEQKRVSKTQLIKMFMEINAILQPERQQLVSPNRWSVMTMAVSADGRIKTDFDYADISDCAVAYEQRWRKQYLK